MDIKSLVGEKVKHLSFGEGVIESVYGNYLGIDFPQCNRKSEFVYPSCFDTFLKLEKTEKQSDIANDLEQWKVESGADRKAELRQQYEKTQQGIRARQLAAEERKQKIAEKSAQRMQGQRFSHNRFN